MLPLFVVARAMDPEVAACTELAGVEEGCSWKVTPLVAGPEIENPREEDRE